MDKKIEIILVEDHPEYRAVLELAINRQVDIELVAQFGAAETALRALQPPSTNTGPDLILLDLNLPGLSGLDSISWFKEARPNAKIIILTQSNKEADIIQAIAQGASGYLLKSSTVTQITQGIRTVAQGGATIDDNIAKFILTTLNSHIPKQEIEKDISERELEILALLAEGFVKKEIAEQLGISPSTVVTHVKHIYEKLDVNNAPAAIAKAFRSGIFPV